MLKVVKFGGSSLADAGQFRKVKNIVTEGMERRVVVVSAPGKGEKNGSKVTDMLYRCHDAIGTPLCREIFEEICARFVSIRDGLGLKCDVESRFEQLWDIMDETMTRDFLASRGEYFSALLMADFLGYTFLDAVNCVFFATDGEIDRERTYEAIRTAYERRGALVIPGFYGRGAEGVETMSRGGSDITGSLAAAALDAEIYENWTDVSGILMADPKIVSDPRRIPHLTYGELSMLSHMGASVLHPMSVAPVRDKGIPINIRNTERPQDDGTFIEDRAPEGGDGGRFITGVTGRRGFSVFTVHKKVGFVKSAFVRAALEIFEHYRVQVEHVTFGIDAFSLVASASEIGGRTFELIRALEERIAPEYVSLSENVSLVAAVGRRMVSRRGVSGRLFRALGDNGVNIRMIAQDTDEQSIVVGVEDGDFENTIRVLYNEFALT